MLTENVIRGLLERACDMSNAHAWPGFCASFRMKGKKIELGLFVLFKKVVSEEFSVKQFRNFIKVGKSGGYALLTQEFLNRFLVDAIEKTRKNNGSNERCYFLE